MTNVPDGDLIIRNAVLEELAHDARIDAAAIGVAVDNGIVSLSGHVPSMVQRIAAELATRRVKGVRAVAQEIEVRVPAQNETADDAIAARAADILSWSADLPARNIEVAVTEGVVKLDGEVEWQHQRLEAERLVHGLTGVRGVRNDLIVHPRVEAGEVEKIIGRALRRSAELEHARIEVEVDGSKVFLSGKARTWREQFAAEQAAWSTPGVTGVVNNIEIGP